MSNTQPREPGKQPDRPRSTRPRAPRSWWPWVLRSMVGRYGRDNVSRLAEESGVNRTVIMDWRDKSVPPLPHSVAAVASVFEVNVIDAYIAAGLFTRAEFDRFRRNGAERLVSDEVLAEEVVRRRLVRAIELRTVPNSALTAEALRRMEAGSSATPGSASGFESAPRRRDEPDVPTGRTPPPHRDDSPTPSGEQAAD